MVEGDGIQFAEEFEKRIPCRIRTHKKFGTAIILFPDGSKVDVATARVEVYESPAALPMVERGSIRMDLYRRDFTINALAFQLNPKGFGELIDYFGGVKDIKEKVIRVLHNLSFVEDPSRVFRAIRLEQRLGFQIGKHTQHLMRNAVKMGFMDRFSGGRVLAELILILDEENPALILDPARGLQDVDLAPGGAPAPRAGESPLVARELNLRDALNKLERELLLEAHHRADGVRKEAAHLLGIDPRNLSYYLRKHELDSTDE